MLRRQQQEQLIRRQQEQLQAQQQAVLQQQQAGELVLGFFVWLNHNVNMIILSRLWRLLRKVYFSC